MNVSELQECLERMRTIYPFQDDKTKIRLEKNPSKCDVSVCISTYDEESDVTIDMDATPRSWRLDGENLYK